MFITGPPNKTPIVYVYPALRKPSYYTYYLLGLEEVFGKRSLRFSCDGFPKFYEHGLALRFLVADDVERRVFISAGDGPGMNTKALAWCHRYAKVNLDPEVVPAHGREKVVPIGPSFGLRPSNLPNSITHTLLNLWHSPTLSYAGTRHHLAHFWAQWRRLPQEAYCPTDSRADSDYIFFAGTLWKEEDATNRFRAAFIEVARSAPGVEFEGGFAPRRDVSGYEHLYMNQRLPLKQYIQKTKASTVVFNTPAVAGCLGWKLGEFLALGKAIISTPIGRRLPFPLKHGRDVHFVDGSKESIKSAINLIRTDVAYRQYLEKNARNYYDRYLRPASVINRIVSAAYDER